MRKKSPFENIDWFISEPEYFGGIISDPLILKMAEQLSCRRVTEFIDSLRSIVGRTASVYRASDHVGLEICTRKIEEHSRMLIATLLAEPFLTVHMLCIEKRLCTNPVKFLLSMLSALLSNSFEPRLNRCSFPFAAIFTCFRRAQFRSSVSPKN